MEKPPRTMISPILFNFFGISLLCLSLIAQSPIQFTTTLIIGILSLAAGFIAWAFLVVKEAWDKGLFR